MKRKTSWRRKESAAEVKLLPRHEVSPFNPFDRLEPQDRRYLIERLSLPLLPLKDAGALADVCTRSGDSMKPFRRTD